MGWSYRGVLAAVAVVAATAAGGVGCSLLAPSDEALMGGDGSAPMDATTDGALRRDAEGGSIRPDASASDDSDTTGCTCAPAPPSGWTLVAFAETNAVCPAGFGPPQAVEVAPVDAGAACTCHCAVEAGACDTGQISVVFAADAACSGSSTAVSLSGSCASAPGAPNVSANTYLQVTPPAVTACGATAIPTLSSPVSATLCAAGAIDPGACPTGSICAPSVPAPYAACVAQAGSVPCPSGFSHAYQVGSSFTDTRTCSDCACGPVPCTGNLQLWAVGGCNGTPDLSASIDGLCDSYGNAAFTARRYEAVITDGGCAVTAPSTLDGGLSPQAPETVCCP